MPGLLRAKVAGVWEEVFAPPSSTADPGDIEATIAPVAPGGWLLFGQTYTGADALYPDLWAVAPTVWKVGSDLVLPDATDCMMMGGGAVGAVGGLNTVTLAAANLPVHAHSLSSHTHTNNHDHASFNTASTALPNSVSHVHDVNQDNVVNGTGGILLRGVAQQWSGKPFAVAGAHTHVVDLSVQVPAFTGNSGASSAANTGNSTGGTALTMDITPKHMRVNWIIKT